MLCVSIIAGFMCQFDEEWRPRCLVGLFCGLDYTKWLLVSTLRQHSKVYTSIPKTRKKKRTFGKMAFLERSRGLSERRPGFFAESNQSALLESLKKWGQIAESFPLLNSFWRCCLFFSKNVYVLLLLCLFILLWPLTTNWQFS